MTPTPYVDEADDLISTAELLKVRDDRARYPTAGDGARGTRPVPRITRMPAGSRVAGRRVGHAVGHWVLQVRCECGRRWFEVKAVDRTSCPRCGALVMVDIETR
jgi:hypothetical protein